MSTVKSFSVGNGDMFYIKHHYCPVKEEEKHMKNKLLSSEKDNTERLLRI